MYEKYLRMKVGIQFITPRKSSILIDLSRRCLKGIEDAYFISKGTASEIVALILFTGIYL